MEKNTMLQPPRSISGTFFSWRELGTSILQGLMITAGVLLVYQYAARKGMDEKATRTMVFTVLVSANIFLTLVNRSFYYSVLTTIRYRNKLVPMIIAITLLITGLLLFVPPLTRFFDFAPLSNQNLLFSVVAGFVSVIWYEGIKTVKRHTKNESFYQ